jgi:eukaryotic-like serine/threonine-protein kinase
MSDPNPLKSDLVLGGQNSPPINAAVLGGDAGKKQRLVHELGLSNELIKNNDVFSFETVTVNDKGEIIIRIQKSALCYTENLSNGVTLDMIYIPAGELILFNGKDNFIVQVPSFHIGKYPITQAQYQAIMGYNPSWFKGNNLPVEQINWYKTRDFCHQLSQKTGKLYTLPSKNQWEYACRAGTTSAFYFGEAITVDLVNYQASNLKGTTEVGKFPPNSFGLHDMHGNVREMLASFHDYNQATNFDAIFMGGGSWKYNAQSCCSRVDDYSRLYDFDICIQMKNDKYNDIGFRVMVSHDSKEQLNTVATDSGFQLSLDIG